MMQASKNSKINPVFILSLTFFSYFLVLRQSHAIEPFSILAAGSAVVGAISSAVDKTSEVSASIDSVSELYNEVDSGSSVDEEGKKLLRDIDEMRSLYGEAKDAGESVGDASQFSVEESKKLSSTISKVTKAIRAGKKAVNLFKKLDQKAHSAAIESLDVQKEQLAQLYAIKRLETEQNNRELKRELKYIIEKERETKFLREKLTKEGAKWFPSKMVMSFPNLSQEFEKSIKSSESLRAPLIALVALVFFARLIFYRFSFFGPERVGDLVRDVLVFSFLIMIYPDLIRVILGAIDSVRGSVGSGALVDIKPDGNASVFSCAKEGLLNGKACVIALWAKSWLEYIVFHVTKFVVTFGLAFLILIFPVVIFFSQMMNFAFGWAAFIGIFTMLAAWPVLWNLVGVACESIAKTEEWSFTAVIYSILFTLVQLATPLWASKLVGNGSLKSVAAGVSGLVTGSGRLAQGAYQAPGQVRDTASSAVNVIKKGTQYPGQVLGKQKEAQRLQRDESNRKWGGAVGGFESSGNNSTLARKSPSTRKVARANSSYDLRGDWTGGAV